ncbi:hypothetical protein HYH03_011827 [Edaphochlamys debaryana]|uniref:glycerophosphodiester phosphodiesterase n=1 Tax=Edaphochlamys debaryana TaxID=47281 RepID=A0A835XU17_9CHLO|nr:hypothetical protein HYH03_011827 [Edaphochlamys debaryana]|eukprot:KAG2489720.1 hypothetical protein HYH03_011827 [Edaphochlamys debaryana]
MVCAHGGDTTRNPPNTGAAFSAALAAGADCVEVDAAMSRDGVLVVLHVRELAQLLGKTGMQVGDLPSSDLLSLRWASGESVIGVEEAVRLTSPFVSCVTLDVKTYNGKGGEELDGPRIAEALVALVGRTGCTNCLIWAKSDAVVRRILELSPGQRTGYIVMNETEEARSLGMHHPLRFGRAPVPQLSSHHLQRQNYHAPGEPEPPTAPQDLPRQPARAPQPGASQPGVVGVHHAMVEPELADIVHGAGKQLFAWTVNQAEVLKAVLDVGVDALVTNYPQVALEAIDARITKCGSHYGGAKELARRGGRRSGPGAPGPDGDYL